ncbi:MAG: hypothetical protein AB8G18_19495 [Gammaproteobacteria bacterium]
MLLRSITKHVKDQNWFAVALDFFIVVIGVFIGLQVANWNEAREDRNLEREYLTRLQAELKISVEENKDYLNTWRKRVSALSEVASYFNGESNGKELGKTHCEAIVRSHLFSGEIALPATISELQSTGRLTLISDDSIRNQIVQFSRAVDRFLLLNVDIQGHRVTLDSLYPELITRFPTGDMSGATCRFSEMDRSPAFINDFSGNYARFSAYFRVIMKAQQDQRYALLEALNKSAIENSARAK